MDGYAATSRVYKFRVTLLNARGRSGSRFFSTASATENNCAGMIYGIGEYSSGIRAGIGITRAAKFAAVRFRRSVITTVSAFNPRNRISICCMDGHVAPDGVNRNAGKLGSTIAIGPCRKSAD